MGFQGNSLKSEETFLPWPGWLRPFAFRGLQQQEEAFCTLECERGGRQPTCSKCERDGLGLG